ncbi:MAG TPA: plasmid pRiA4b ORF-3 family protein [Candidatus Brocadiia bacterium]|nr:plasmid pRiA4b ORF-3 family protein [Candidatus Brocadiia bacterium]
MTPESASKAQEQILVLKISLDYTIPEVWRRVEVPASYTLGDLHSITQIAMGWDDQHIHEFSAGKKVRYSPGSGPGALDDTEDEDCVTVGEVLNRARKAIAYTYDFGDSWRHTIRREKAMPPAPGVTYPRCVGGERAAPPEDCGGICGYHWVLDVLAKEEGQRTESDKEFLDWLGRYDPEAFDLAKVNKALAKLS